MAVTNKMPAGQHADMQGPVLHCFARTLPCRFLLQVAGIAACKGSFPLQSADLGGFWIHKRHCASPHTHTHTLSHTHTHTHTLTHTHAEQHMYIPWLFSLFCWEQGFDNVRESSRTLKLFAQFDVQFWKWRILLVSMVIRPKHACIVLHVCYIF